MQFLQWCVGRDRLPVSQHALGVHHFTAEHGAPVHGKRQDVHSLFFAFNFHVRASRLVRHAARGFLRCFEIKHAPKTAHVARTLDPGHIDVVGAVVVRVDLSPLCASRSPKQGKDQPYGQQIQGFSQDVHACTIKYPLSQEKLLSMCALNSQKICQLWLTKFAHASILCFAVALGGCGGGGGSASNGGGTPPVTEPPTDTAALLSPGVFTALVDGKDWVAILMRSASGTGSAANLYGLHFNTQDPDLYAGSVLGVGAASASVSNLTFFQNISGILRTGSATLTSPSAGSVKSVFNFAATANDTAKEITWLANPIAVSTYRFDTPAQASALQGVWRGRLSYGLGGYADSFTLTIAADGDMQVLQTFYQDCQMSNATATPAVNSVNLYSIAFSVPNATQCFLKNQALTGAGFISASTTPGKTQRLQWVAVAPDGKGLSYLAER